jgi:excisionase family DNA binding protein
MISQNDNERRSYRIKDLVKIMSMSRATIYRQIDKGFLKITKVGNITLVMREDLDAFYDHLKFAA